MASETTSGLSYRRYMRNSQSRGRPLFRPEAAHLPPLSSLTSMVGWPEGTSTFPRWREWLRCTCARKTPPLGRIVQIKGGITHTVSPNFMLILSTYRVVLHPSYLQKVFSFIIFIKEIYSFTILSIKSRAPGGTPWAEL